MHQPSLSCENAGLSRAAIIREAYRRYHRGDITLPELLRVVAQWRAHR